MSEIGTETKKQEVIHAIGADDREVEKEKEISKEQRGEYIQKFADRDGYKMRDIAVELASGDLTFDQIREAVDRDSQKKKEPKERREKGEGRIARMFDVAREKVQEMGKNFLKWFTEEKKPPRWVEEKRAKREGREPDPPSPDDIVEDLKKASKSGLFSESAQSLFENFENKRKQESKQGKGEETERADAEDIKKRIARYEKLIEHQNAANAKKSQIKRAERQRDRLREELNEKNKLLKEIEQVEEAFTGDQLVCIYGLSKDMEAINAGLRKLNKKGDEISLKVNQSKEDMAESVGVGLESNQSVDDYLKEHCSDDKEFSRLWANVFKGYEKDKKGHEALVKVEKERVARLQEAIDHCAPGIATMEAREDGTKILKIETKALESAAVRNKLEEAVIQEVFEKNGVDAEGFLKGTLGTDKSHIEVYVGERITPETVNSPENREHILAIYEVLSQLCVFAPDIYNAQKEQLKKVVSENKEAAEKTAREIARKASEAKDLAATKATEKTVAELEKEEQEKVAQAAETRGAKEAELAQQAKDAAELAKQAAEAVAQQAVQQAKLAKEAETTSIEKMKIVEAALQEATAEDTEKLFEIIQKAAQETEGEETEKKSPEGKLLPIIGNLEVIAAVKMEKAEKSLNLGLGEASVVVSAEGRVEEEFQQLSEIITKAKEYVEAIKTVGESARAAVALAATAAEEKAKAESAKTAATAAEEKAKAESENAKKEREKSTIATTAAELADKAETEAVKKAEEAKTAAEAAQEAAERAKTLFESISSK